MSTLSIRPAASDAEYQTFLRMPWTVYQDDPCWVAPLWKEHVRFFNPAHNPELGHIDWEKFVAWRDGKPVGTIIASVNHAYNEFQEQNAGWFGQFELLDDAEAGCELLRTAEVWLRDRGVDTMMGPATFSSNSEIGLLIDGFEHPPMILTSHARPYYRGFVESYGLRKAMDLYAWFVNIESWRGPTPNPTMQRIARVVERLRKRRSFTVRPVNMRDFDRELEKVKKIYNAAWARNWGFIPMNGAEIDHHAAGLKDLLDPNIAFFVEVEGEPIAVAIPLPNVYEPLRKAKMKPGEPEWRQLARLLWHWKITGKQRSVRVWAMGILEEYRASGIDALLYYEMLTRGLARGYSNVEMSWILENNDMMNRAIEMTGAHIYKTYRVYEKALS